VLRRLGFGFFLLVAGGGQAFAHDRIVLNARRATPGLRLEMHSLPQTATATDARYRLQAVGLPKDVKFLLWAKEFDHSVHQLVASVFQVDKFGNVMASNSGGGGRPRRLDEMVFGPGPYPPGALWEVALVSVDQKLQAFAKTIPYPIRGSAGECTVSLELVSHRGEKFLAAGSGFPPGDEVTTESRYAGRVIEKRMRTSAEGSLPPQVLLHASVNTDRQARYSVKGRSCEVAVDYDWGEAALVRR
jgi:hypothetical protein